LEVNQFIRDKELFLARKGYKFSLSDSFETIANYMRTIKEYRDYAHPDTPEWQEYLHEFFHILGFQTQWQGARLISLADIGANPAPKALVLLLSPGENLETLAPGLDWLSYLYYAAAYHQVAWGFITNGLELKMFDFSRKDYTKVYVWINLDRIIQEKRQDSFFDMYKYFSLLRHSWHPPVPIPPTEAKLTPVPQEQEKQPQRSSSELPKLLANILDVCLEMDQNGANFNRACRAVAEQGGLSPNSHTVQDACTRRLGINTERFYSLYADKAALIRFLADTFPHHTQAIRESNRIKV
jgi:hypothetical protein